MTRKLILNFVSSLFLLLPHQIIAHSNLSAKSNVSIKGCVFDAETGQIIAGVKAELLNYGSKTITDNFGKFAFENIPNGEYRINFEADGYSNKIIEQIEVVDDVTFQLNVRLSQKVYQLEKIVVKTKKTSLSSSPVTTISRQEINQSGYDDLPELLEAVQGVSVQNTGSSGQNQVKIRGSDAGHVLVLIDGLKINPSGTGVADLSGIPLSSIERVEIYKGGASAEFGSDALAGAINIITRPLKLFSDISVGVKENAGSWKNRSFDLNIVNPIYIRNFSNRWFYKNSRGENNFDYAYSVTGTNGIDSTHTGTRTNNAYDSENIFASGIYKISDKISLNYSGQNYFLKRGLPDRATRQNESALMTDARKLIIGSLNYDFSSESKMSLEWGYSRFQQHFIDDDSLSRLKYNSEFINDIFSIEQCLQFVIWSGFKTRYSTKIQREFLDHTDNQRPALSMGRSVRNNFSTFFAAEQHLDISPSRLFDMAIIDGAVRYNYARTNKDSTSFQDTTRSNSITYWTPKIGLVLTRGEKFSYIFRASYGKSFRLPTINALFWKGDIQSCGNPGLKPEKSEHSEAGAEIQWELGTLHLSGGITYYHSFIKDLVVWAPNAQGVWRPDNLALSQTTGHEDFFKIGLFNEKINFSYQNTISTALNKTPGHNSYSNRLPFTPDYITAFALKLNLAPMYGSYSIRLVDRAYTNEANTRFYDSYRLDDARLGFKTEISKKWSFTAEAKVNNIHNTNFVLITQYPMPGREWSFFIGLNYGIHKEP